MEYISDLDLGDLVDDFREDNELTTDMKIELRMIARAVNRKLLEYANSKFSDDSEHDFGGAVFYLKGKFYADADFGNAPALLPCPSLSEAAFELGYFKEEDKWEEKLYDDVDWRYHWTVRKAFK